MTHTGYEIFKIMAKRYQADAGSLRQQAEVHGLDTPKGVALLTASYVANTLRNAALDVCDAHLVGEIFPPAPKKKEND